MAMKSTHTFGLEEVHNVLRSVKGGLTTEKAIAMIGKLGGGDLYASDVDDDDDDDDEDCEPSDLDDSSSIEDSSGTNF